ncbi:MAG: hypothetical protein ACLQBA_11325, partial [Candidatus Binataceae bacterium]
MALCCASLQASVNERQQSGRTTRITTNCPENESGGLAWSNYLLKRDGAGGGWIRINRSDVLTVRDGLLREFPFPIQLVPYSNAFPAQGFRRFCSAVFPAIAEVADGVGKPGYDIQ